MKKPLISLMAVLLIMPGFTGLAGAQESDGPESDESGGPNWQMTWNDEFDGDELDQDKWRIDIGNGFYDGDNWIEGWGNNESQSYQEDNVFIDDGHLVLEAREESVSDDKGDYDFTSGKVLTDESFSQAYGRFEASMKLPEGQGYWPAFWMMPQDDVYGGWAASGEIDIMENRGSETDKVGAAIHYGDLWPDNTYTAAEYHFPEDRRTTDFNEYAIEWEPGEIRWYVNDELYSTKTEWGTKYGEYPAPFDQEFHMILNLAIGGWYGGEPDETTVFPGQVKVDYVRVYEDADAEHPPPGEYIDPDDSDEEPTVDPSKNWVEIGENLIQDGTFETTTEFGDENGGFDWNVFNMGDHDPNGGKADFTIENEELRATINQVGWTWWHIQLMQDVPDVKAGTYKLEFDMRSEEERTIRTKLDGSGSGLVDVEVSNDMETHEVYFEVNSPSDLNVLFGLGRDGDQPELDTPYDMHLDNVRLVEVAVDGESDGPSDPNEFDHWVESGESLIEDGSFEYTTEFGDENNSIVWNVFNMGDYDPNAGSAAFEIVVEELKATINQPGWEWWHIQFMQDVTVPEGVYKVAFDMRSEKDRPVYVELVGSDTGILTFDVDGEMDTYHSYINVSETGDFNFMFGLGRTASDVEPETPYSIYLDNVRLVPVEKGEEEDMRGHPGLHNKSVDENGNLSIINGNGRTIDIPAQPKGLLEGGKPSKERNQIPDHAKENRNGNGNNR
ncbi:glycoside hydrolase family 16 protein [Salisediminibacterium beveridgei]|uniref:Glucan endo-1,3-beta-glucosidase A1 n=1 Tax=Salisediminibacterium beveridgei TaxID=632773 RepID=A0A1D7QRY2_9BACI|nr:glycoside hydrolase family 16 protein [Salisediminibacterium beveridgei]AOM81765.1 Glucan endo-1,3-beta-glucosidase A1 [Salisediminibacterium beveridgei]